MDLISFFISFIFPLASLACASLPFSHLDNLDFSFRFLLYQSLPDIVSSYLSLAELNILTTPPRLFETQVEMSSRDIGND